MNDSEVTQFSAGSYHILLQHNVIPVDITENSAGFAVLK
jgi:hypothetical protein